MNRGSWFLTLAAAVASAQNVPTTKVESRALTRTVALTGEFRPFQTVDVHARVTGFVEKMLVDRGTPVKQGQLLAILSAPEMDAQVAEAEARFLGAQSRVLESKSRVTIAQSTLQRLRTASQTAGAVSGQEIAVVEQTLEEGLGVVTSAEAAAKAAQASRDAVKRLREYLKIEAPFAGVVTERYAHPGALAAPGSGPLFKLEQVNRLRLVVAVPESIYGAVAKAAKIPFKVAAWPDRTFAGTVARFASALDSKTRTMAVELEVTNLRNELAPGMFADIQWPVKTSGSTLLVVPTAIVTTTERTFVIRVNAGRAEWVTIRRGAKFDSLQEVFGDIQAGDTLVLRGTDEIPDGRPLNVQTKVL